MRLNVSAATRRTALLKLMIDLRSLRIGVRLPVVELMSVWNTTGLRGDDLSAGLNECLEAGILDFAVAGADPSVALTAAGASWLDSLEARGEIAAQRPVLESAQQRRRESVGVPRIDLYERRLNAA